MLVYLLEAVERAEGLERLNLTTLRESVLEGVVHRFRAKLLTKGTAVIGLAPMLWSHGVVSEIIRPLATPVLRGILVAEEVVDLFLSVLFWGLGDCVGTGYIAARISVLSHLIPRHHDSLLQRESTYFGPITAACGVVSGAAGSVTIAPAIGLFQTSSLARSRFPTYCGVGSFCVA
jgi:AcrB/AcrD/AcrF family